MKKITKLLTVGAFASAILLSLTSCDTKDSEAKFETPKEVETLLASYDIDVQDKTKSIVETGLYNFDISMSFKVSGIYLNVATLNVGVNRVLKCGKTSVKIQMPTVKANVDLTYDYSDKEKIYTYVDYTSEMTSIKSSDTSGNTVTSTEKSKGNYLLDFSSFVKFIEENTNDNSNSNGNQFNIDVSSFDTSTVKATIDGDGVKFTTSFKTEELNAMGSLVSGFIPSNSIDFSNAFDGVEEMKMTVKFSKYNDGKTVKEDLKDKSERIYNKIDVYDEIIKIIIGVGGTIPTPSIPGVETDTSITTDTSILC